MASTGPMFHNSVMGKPSYQAPEMHTKYKYKAFLSDTFAVGVVVFVILLRDYPWLSTKPGCCKCFEYIKQNDLRSFCKVRKARGSSRKVAECISGSLMQLLEGMLKFDPNERLTMGSKHWPDRKSIWDEPWVKMALQSAEASKKPAKAATETPKKAPKEELLPRQVTANEPPASKRKAKHASNASKYE